MGKDIFEKRHLGPRPSDVRDMLSTIGVASIDELISKTIPEQIRLKQPLAVGEAMTENEYLDMLKAKGAKNAAFKSYIGLGYYGTIVPPVIQRNVLENPGWYTAYTPYQAEISQGRLEALLNFQTMVMDLTGMEIANASLLDEGTAAAEAMIMFFNSRSRAQSKAGVNKCFASEFCFPQTLDILKLRADALGIELVIGDETTQVFDESFFGAIIQYPDKTGELKSGRAFVEALAEKDIKVAVAADLLSLCLITPPGEWGADVVFGNSQRFGVPMGHGGPHAAFFATKESFKRVLPGRIIGVSKDSRDQDALRMALQTREQHIRRDKATSNICTAQALLAVMASMYAVYHGPKGLAYIAKEVHDKTYTLSNALQALGFNVKNKSFFDTLTIQGLSSEDLAAIKANALEAKVNLRYEGSDVGISLDQTITAEHLNTVFRVFAKLKGAGCSEIQEIEEGAVIRGDVSRVSSYMMHPVFNSYHSETDMMRYLKKLENRDLSLVHSMIPLGSCTMKLNAAAELMPITWPEFAQVHPFVPKDQVQGTLEIFEELEKDLSDITGFAGVSLQPNSGAQGEYTGLMVIRAYHQSRGDHHRNICLIPASAHGTNPASAVMAGMKVVVTKCDDQGNIDVTDLKAKAEEHKDNLAALMVTYPSTHGVYEEAIMEVTDIIHQNGGQVYMDGANMNAQVGLTSPGNIQADVCHLNLHKTFAIPHGGGGPGMGPIGVAAHLKPFLPGHAVIETGGDQAIPAVSAAPWGSSLILLISYGYIKMLGTEGLRASTEYAILNANYIKKRLSAHYDVLYTGKNDTVAHEMILDCRDFRKIANIEVADIAKRLIDYGFHAPTVSFPVAETLMVEPTESESKAELDRFCDAMIQIREEVKAIEDGLADRENNVVKRAPHTQDMVISSDWDRPYSREAAAFPLPYVQEAKYWPAVGRVDNAFGDRNLICSCPSISEYEEAMA